MSFEHGKNTIAKTDKGLVRGFKKDDVYHFYGLDYAKSERFMRPCEADPWEGVKEATNYGFTTYPFMPDGFGNGLKSPHRYWPNGENCLNLNLWTKHLDPSAKKPVFVWFHGGGFVNGSALDLYAFDGCNLCNFGDCVVITINHRLNVFGYLDLRDYGEKYQYSVNVGNWDLIEALRWVQRNVENFGGDKDNVTIFGQSGGGMKTISVMNMPASEGLYRRAMVLSGIAGNSLGKHDMDDRIAVKKMMENLGFTDVEQLRTLTHRQLADAFLAAYQEVYQRPPFFGPKKNIDYQGDPFDYGFIDSAKKAPMIVGTNFSEFFNLPKGLDRSVMSDEEMTSTVEKYLGKECADRVIPEFLAHYPDKKILDILQYDAGIFRAATKRFADLRATSGCAPTYEYIFSPTININDGSMPQHNSDISYFFLNTDKVPSNDIGPMTEVLSENMTGRLVSFAYTDHPDYKDYPTWPSVTTESHPTMIFDIDNRVDEHVDDFLGDLESSGYYRFKM